MTATLDLDTLHLDKGAHDSPDDGACVMDPRLVASFWARVEAGPDCWRWVGHIHPQTGYGSFSYRGKGWRATRLSLAIHGRPVPDGMDACHTCDNRWCVNPAHLYAGTRRQNMADCTERGRHNKPTGESHWCAKLSDEDVADIRASRLRGELLAPIAKRYGVHPATVSRICRGTWRKAVSP